MAKSILIEYVSVISEEGAQNKSRIVGGSKVMVFPLTDDVNIEATSEFASMTDSVPYFDDIAKLVTKVDALDGSVGQGTLDLQNISNIQTWQRTNPIRLNLNLLLYTKTSAKLDVYDPMMELISLTVLTQDTKNPGKYKVPGISLSTLSMSAKKNQKKSAEGESKLVSIRIPGIVYIPLALVTKAIPTISKEETDSGYPLWATLNVEITSLYPATSDLLTLESSTFDTGTGDGELVDSYIQQTNIPTGF